MRPRTGDRVVDDGEGRLTDVGRLDEEFVVNGMTVSPADVEDVLQSSPLVREAAVAAVAHGDGMTAPWAFVVLERRMSSSAVERDLTARCRAALPGHCVPRRVVAVGGLPRTADGKLLRSRLSAAVGVERRFDDVYIG